MALFLLVVVLAIVLGVIGSVVRGLFYVLVIGVVLFVADVAFVGARMRRRRRSPR